MITPSETNFEPIIDVSMSVPTSDSPSNMLHHPSNGYESSDDDKERDFDASKLLIDLVEKQYEKKQNRNIWENSKWKHIAELENDDVGRVGENFVQTLCDTCGIEASIDGTKTKEKGGGIGDGTIKNKSVEIKTARGGSGKAMSFQHELGEKPWHADYMLFIDIGPNCFYLTLFPNFKEEQYKSSCKCEPYFPSRSFCWRKGSGCFKFDTTETLNEEQSKKENPHTLKWTPETKKEHIQDFIHRIVTDKHIDETHNHEK